MTSGARGLARPSDAPLYVGLFVAALAAAASWVPYVRTGAHLFHFDAKAHLVVARRTLDSLTPGWEQLGSVWLPLPHVLNALPAQNDALYATGLFASGLSFVAFLAALAALAHAGRTAARDAWAGVVAAAVPALNPGWLYLQATPLIEALFLMTVCLALAGFVSWHVRASTRGLVLAAALSALACWVRYEAWPLMTLAAAWMVIATPPERRPLALKAAALGVAAPMLAYGVHSWIVSGIPFYAIGSENLTERRFDVARALRLTVHGLVAGFGMPLLLCAGAAAAATLHRVRREALPALALAAAAPLTVTFTAYLAGHPPKARYALLVAPALGLALAGATRNMRLLQVAALAAAAAQFAWVPTPLPVLVESLRDRHDVAERRPVLDDLRRDYEGGRILASMASLAPVLFELGQRGIPLREVVHEGNGSWWEYAVVDPGREVEWIMIARGDVLDRVRQIRSDFPEGFTPAHRFGGVTIYRRSISPGHERAHSLHAAAIN